MYILGLSFDYHDSAAALLHDGVVIAAAEEERLSRVKHDSSIPARSASFCMDQAAITSEDLSAVIFYEKTYLKLERIIETIAKMDHSAQSALKAVTEAWINGEKFDPKERISCLLKVPQNKIFAVQHHESHAAASFFSSPFEKATIITVDGVGEYETLTVSIGSANSIEKLYAAKLPHSIGLLYSAFTAFLGFEVNEGEYKVMGMAGFGQPVYKKQTDKLVSKLNNGLFEIDQNYFEFGMAASVPYNASFIGLFGSPRTAEDKFVIDKNSVVANFKGTVEQRSRHYANIAASIQSTTEDLLLHVAKYAITYTGINNLCLSGGVALNSVANNRLQRELGVNLYVQPAAGDAGGALGAALHYHHRLPHAKRSPPLTSPYLGRRSPDQEIAGVINRLQPRHWRLCDNEDVLIRSVAGLLANGQVVGWCQGRFEWGPRALGNRSILADPRSKQMQDIVNTKIKYREPFRPFAPAVLKEYAHDYFDISPAIGLSSPEFFMLSVGRVKKDKLKIIPAVTHFDGTARVQVVSMETNPLFYKLISAFMGLTGVPVLLNTSFNLRGEAMVGDAYDAIETFGLSEMDAVAIELYLLHKSSIV